MAEPRSVPASEAQYREVAEAVASSDIAKAIELARGHLEAGAVHPTFLNLRAYWHETNGRLADAMEDLETARALAPRDPIVLNAYGLCAAKLGNISEAAAAFDLACAGDRDFAQAHFNKAWANEALGELDIARRHYETAATLAPENADAHAGLAWLSTRRSDWQQARSSAQKALQAVPEQPLAHLALASADLHEGSVQGAEARLKALLSDPRLRGQNRAIALGALGDCLDAQDRTAEAFDAYCASKAEFATAFGPQIAQRSSQSVFEMVRWLESYFAHSAPWPRQHRRVIRRQEPAQHIFLIGFPRSGTTLLEQILASHPDIVTMDEKEALADSVRRFMRSPKDVDFLRDAEEDELDKFRDHYWSNVRQLDIKPEGRIFVDKLALNSIKLPLICRLFPDAKILLALRDPRDVVWGCFKQRFQMNPAMLEFATLEGAARFYDATMQLLHTYLSKLTPAVYVNRYEDLVTSFEAKAQDVCAFVGAPWSEAMRDFVHRARIRSISTPSSTQVAKGLYSSGIGQWRRYATQIKPALEVVRPWVTRFGYENGPDSS